MVYLLRLDFNSDFNTFDNILNQTGDILMKFIEKVIISIFILLTTVFVTLLILKITGHSPTDIQILYVGFSVLISYLLVMSYKIGLFVGKVNEFMNTTKNSFNKIDEVLKKKK